MYTLSRNIHIHNRAIDGCVCSENQGYWRFHGLPLRAGRRAVARKVCTLDVFPAGGGRTINDVTAGYAWLRLCVHQQKKHPFEVLNSLVFSVFLSGKRKSNLVPQISTIQFVISNLKSSVYKYVSTFENYRSKNESF